MQLAQAGFDVTVHARSRQQEAEQVVEGIHALGQASHALLFDVNEREKVLQLLEAGCLPEHGAFYGVVLNAGLTRDAAFPGLNRQRLG